MGTSLPPPTTVISRLLSDQVLDIFQKKSCGGHHKTSKSSLDDFHRKNAVDVIEVLFEHESIRIEIVPQLKKIQKKFKKNKKNAVDIIRLLFEHESITIEIVPQLKNFSTFRGVSRLFAKTKCAKTKPKLELRVL